MIRPLPGAPARLRSADGTFRRMSDGQVVRFPRRRGRPRKVANGDIGGDGVSQVTENAGANGGTQPCVACVPLPPRLLDLDGAAAYLGVSPWVVRDLEHAGRLPRVRLDLGGRQIRKLLYDREALDRLVDGSQT